MNVILSLTIFYLKNIFRLSIYSDFSLNIYYYLYLFYILLLLHLFQKPVSVSKKKLNSFIIIIRLNKSYRNGFSKNQMQYT